MTRFAWLKTRQTKYSAYVTAYILVILAVLGAVNFLANRYNKSYDSTANKQFSLSDQTIKVVKGLKTDVTITTFDTSEKFPQAKDLLGRYANLSSKLTVKYVDPVKKPQQAKAAGYRRDLQLLVENGPRKEEAKSLSEEEITGAIIRSLKTGERNACVVSGFGEHGVEDSGPNGYSFMKQLLERDNYKVRAITMTPQAPAGADKTVAVGQAPAAGNIEVPKDCTAVVVGGPKMAYPAAVANALKTYVENGGRVLFLLDTPVRLGREEPVADSPELLAALADWGVTPNKDLVLDLSGTGAILQLGPEVPLVTTYEPHIIVRELKGVATAFPLTRSLDIKSGDKTTVDKVLATSDDSVAITSIPAGGRVDPSKGKKGAATIAAAGTYKGGQQGRFVVVGTSQWSVNSLLGSRVLANRDLFLNMVNWLTSDEDLISIRPKEPEDRRIDISAQRLSLVFWLSVVFFPLAVVGSGLMVWWRRR